MHTSEGCTCRIVGADAQSTPPSRLLIPARRFVVAFERQEGATRTQALMARQARRCCCSPMGWPWLLSKRLANDERVFGFEGLGGKGSASFLFLPCHFVRTYSVWLLKCSRRATLEPINGQRLTEAVLAPEPDLGKHWTLRDPEETTPRFAFIHCMDLLCLASKSQAKG